jgi:hypothetical protein
MARDLVVSVQQETENLDISLIVFLVRIPEEDSDAE